MADDLEDWEHVVGRVEEETGGSADEDAIQRELEALLADGLVEAYALPSPAPESRLTPTTPDSARLRDEWTYWFYPTEAGMRLFCDATGVPFPEGARFPKTSTS
jgi:hypothetical protein